MPFLETRGILSKLLATENLNVCHDSTAFTASFDTPTRTLTLPVLNTDNEHVYNLFVGHEVGHALETPVEWATECPPDVPQDFINVVEDVRIEKYIQSKFPGLRVDFTKGYDYLNEQDFFNIADADISTFSLIDRINLHFKLGARAFVPFSDEEQYYVNAVDTCETWDDVLVVASMLKDYTNAKQHQQQEEQQQDQQSGKQSKSAPPSSQSNSGENEQDGDDGDNPTGEHNDEGSKGAANEDISKTQRSFDESLDKITRNDNTNRYTYVDVSDINSDDIITSISHVRATTVSDPTCSSYKSVAYDFKEYLTSIKSDVNHMVQQFEMKKSADAYARQTVHKTGVIDVNRLHNYKLTDDIFLKQSVTPDGKNHGMVMFLDWSGSMSDVCVSTVKQIITLVQFCRKIQIPFDVYLFTSGKEEYDRYDYSLSGKLSHGIVNIIHVLTSQAKSKQITTDMFNLYSAACFIAKTYYTPAGLPWSPFYQMGGTPLDNALFLVPDIISKFRAKTNAQKVSFVCVTDGESSSLGFYQTEYYGNKKFVAQRYAYYDMIMLKDGCKVHPLDPYSTNNTASIVSYLNNKMTDVSISNIYLGGPTAVERYLKYNKCELDKVKFRKTGSYTVKTDGWPVIGVVSPKSFGDGNDSIEVDAGVSKAKIKAALGKMLKSKSSNKIVLGHIVGEFA